VQSVSYRVGALQLFLGLQKQLQAQTAEEGLSPFNWDIEPNDAAFRVIAQIPMKRGEIGVPKNDFLFDIDDFVFRIHGEARKPQMWNPNRYPWVSQ
jgi:hypothetical protein